MIQKFLPLIDKFSIQNSIVLLRVDLNIPILNGKVLDNTRIKKIIPTIEYLSKNNNKIIIISHLGRPKGQIDERYSMRQVLPELKKLMNKDIAFSDINIKDTHNIQKCIDNIMPGEILLLENIRFYPEEANNDKSFILKIAQLGDFYVNDAFSCSHRHHASIVGLPSIMKSSFGFAFAEECNALNSIIGTQCTTSLAAIIGGSKVSTKLELLKHLVRNFHCLMLAGAMANTFLVAKDIPIGKSLYDYDSVDYAQEILNIAQEHKCEIILPSDAVVVNNLDNNAHLIRSIEEVDDEQMIVDIGPQTIKNFALKIQQHEMILWNGPLGAYEYKYFDQGTAMIAQFLGQMTQENGKKTVIGGGDSIAALTKLGIDFANFSYVSTSGGAFIYWLIHRDSLPGLAAIVKKNNCSAKA